MLAAKDLINIFPEELLLRIFQYVDKDDLVHSVQHVSPRWHAIAQDNSLWKDYNYKPPAKTRDKVVSKFLEQSPLLKSFTMSSEMEANEIVDTLCKKCKDLKTLRINMTSRLNIRLLKGVFTRIPNLECLTISQAPKKGSKISVDKCFTVKFRSYKEAHPQVFYFTESLNFGVKNCSFIDVIKYVMRRKKEDIISLETNVITDDILKLLEGCKGIEKLKLHFDLYQETLKSNIEFIRNFIKLKSLSIIGYFNDNLMCDLFSKGTMCSVTELNLIWCIDLSDKSAKSIRLCCPHLETLCLDSCLKVTDKGIQELTKCSELRHIKLSSCPLLTAESVKQVCKCRRITHLDLSSYFSDINQCSGYLTSAMQLRVLNLRGNTVDDSLLQTLYLNLRNLTQLSVDLGKACHSSH
ncbi:F-box/LRR-repeat protein 20 [Anabrus simplex]|uniref:F-box/LRR-repeat protein 20 n=1 Tax=Anabrus simplex TaxID=316456 RepID=UPI0035A30CBD